MRSGLPAMGCDPCCGDDPLPEECPGCPSCWSGGHPSTATITISGVAAGPDQSGTDCWKGTKINGTYAVPESEFIEPPACYWFDNFTEDECEDDESDPTRQITIEFNESSFLPPYCTVGVILLGFGTVVFVAYDGCDGTWLPEPDWLSGSIDADTYDWSGATLTLTFS